MNAAVEYRLQQPHIEPWHQWQHAHLGLGLGLAIVELARQGAHRGAAATALQGAERVATRAAHLCTAARRQQLAVEIQLHSGRQALAQRQQRTVEVFPRVAFGGAGGQHGASKQHGCCEAEQLKAQRCGAVGQGVGAVQDQHRIAIVHRHGMDDGLAQQLPVSRGHVGAVDQGQQFHEGPFGHLQLGLRGQLLTHPGLET